MLRLSGLFWVLYLLTLKTKSIISAKRKADEIRKEKLLPHTPKEGRSGGWRKRYFPILLDTKFK